MSFGKNGQTNVQLIDAPKPIQKWPRIISEQNEGVIVPKLSTWQNNDLYNFPMNMLILMGIEYIMQGYLFCLISVGVLDIKGGYLTLKSIQY